MAFEYTKKAKDTMYAGCLFRSRLEATWAAFFDICGIKWVYEPFDLPGWSPDFLIQDKVLAEVKPFERPDEQLVSRICASIRGTSRRSVLFLSSSPIDSSTIGLCIGLEEFTYGNDPVGSAYFRSNDLHVSFDSCDSEWEDFCENPVGDLTRNFNEAKNKVRFAVR